MDAAWRIRFLPPPQSVLARRNAAVFIGRTCSRRMTESSSLGLFSPGSPRHHLFIIATPHATTALSTPSTSPQPLHSLSAAQIITVRDGQGRRRIQRGFVSTFPTHHRASFAEWRVSHREALDALTSTAQVVWHEVDCAMSCHAIHPLRVDRRRFGLLENHRTDAIHR